MAAGSSQALVSELKDALVRFPQNRHTLVIQRVIELFIDHGGQSPHQIEALDEVLVCLIRHADLADLERLSNAIAKSGLMLPSTIATLAAHERTSIATPLLRNSKWVTEQSLVELTETRDQKHLSAISSRAALTKRITTPLVMRGNAGILVEVCRNLDADFTDQSFAMLLKIAEHNEDLARALGARPDIPIRLVRKFLALVTEKARLAFLSAASPEHRAIAEREISPKVNAERDYKSAEKEVGALSRAGKLSDSAVNRFAIQQDQEMLTAALALLSEAPIATIERLLCADRTDELVIACRAARLRWATTVSIVRQRENSAPLSEQQLEEQRGLFESLSLSEAQWTIRFGQSDSSKTGTRGINKTTPQMKTRGNSR